MYFRPGEATPSALPMYLQRVPPATEASEARKRLGFASRKLVVIGHSLGKCTTCQCTLLPPS